MMGINILKKVIVIFNRMIEFQSITIYCPQLFHQIYSMISVIWDLETLEKIYLEFEQSRIGLASFILM